MGEDPVIGIVGTGRAGHSFATVLAARGWQVETLDHEHTSTGTLDRLADRCDMVLLCVPDSAVGAVAAMFSPGVLDEDVVLAHCSGVVGLDPLVAASRRGSIHPLVSLNRTNPESLIGAWFALAGDPALGRVTASLEGKVIEVDDDDRALYHAAAVVASNHLVALLAQVEDLADAIGVPLDAYLDLATGSLRAVAELGPRAALTGPVSRGDWRTVESHLREFVARGLDDEVDAYRAVAARAAVLAGRDPAAIDELVARVGRSTATTDPTEPTGAG